MNLGDLKSALISHNASKISPDVRRNKPKRIIYTCHDKLQEKPNEYGGFCVQMKESEAE